MGEMVFGLIHGNLEISLKIVLADLLYAPCLTGFCLIQTAKKLQRETLPGQNKIYNKPEIACSASTGTPSSNNPT